MKGIVVERGADQVATLSWKDVPDVNHGPGEVLVDIFATAVNRADLLQARGGYPPPPGASEILGLEMAGRIAALGKGVDGWRVGDRVCALLPGGGYAEQVAVPSGMLLAVPGHWSMAQAAAVPEVWLTAFVNLFLEAGLEAGETALIHAGGSGVGTAAIQLTRAAGATPFITAGTEAKLQRGRELGAALAVNYKEEAFLPAVQDATNGRGVDVILDPVGAAHFEANLRALALGGRLVQIGLLSGGKTQIDLGLVMGKMARLIGSRLRSRPVAEKIEITRRFGERFWPLLVNGTLRPVIDRTFPIMDAGDAHQYIGANKNIGKVVLIVRSEDKTT